MTAIAHASIPADDPRRVAEVLAEILDGEALPFPPEEGELREQLRTIRKRGYCVARSEIDRETLGIAAPVVVPEAGIVGSLSLMLNPRDIDDATERRLVLLTVSSASLLTEALQAMVTRPQPLAPAGAGVVQKLR